MRELRPRFQIKRDSESSVDRGCVMLTGHFRPEIAAIPWACGRAIHALKFFVEEVWLTEGFRDIRSSRDMHEELRALDMTLVVDGGARASAVVYRAVARKMRELLGPDYDVLEHGEGTKLHIHAELDPH